MTINLQIPSQDPNSQDMQPSRSNHKSPMSKSAQSDWVSPSQVSNKKPASSSFPTRTSRITDRDNQHAMADENIVNHSGLSQDMQYMKLGNDRDPRDKVNVAQYSEDVADRNIQRYGSGHNSSADSDVGSAHTARTSNSSGGDLMREARRYGTHVQQGRHQRDDSGFHDCTSQLLNYRSHDPTPMRTNNQPKASNNSQAGDETISDVQAGNDAQLHKPEALRSIQGTVNLENTTDIDKSTTWAPAVTHETINRHQHNIYQEQIYREIHNHDVYHYIQPVKQLEILPARHFIPNSSNPNDPSDLIEVSEKDLPGGPKFEQQWCIAAREPSIDASKSKFFEGPRRTEPEIIKDIRYMTAEGFERRETTIIHPPTLEDMGPHSGSVLPIHFDESGVAQEQEIQLLQNVERIRKSESGHNHNSIEISRGVESRKRLTEHHGDQGAIPQHLVPQRASSKKHSLTTSTSKSENKKLEKRFPSMLDV